MSNPGLPRLSGGILAREKAAWQRPCVIHARRGDTSRPASAVVETTAGPQPICKSCLPGAREAGYTVRTQPLTPARRLPLPESLDGCSLALRKAFRDCEDRHGYPAAAAIVQDFDDDDRAAAACPDCRGYHRPGRCPGRAA